MIQLFCHSDKSCVWSKVDAFQPKKIEPTVKHGGGSIMLCGCFATIAIADTSDGIMKEAYPQILKLHLKFTNRWLKLWDSWVLQQENDPKNMDLNAM